MISERPLVTARSRQDEAIVFPLQDGRDLAYLEWGDPTGFPVFYFHGNPSSRLEAGFVDQYAWRHGFRLIATDRPGFGRSTFQKDRRFTDWPGDVTALADGLSIDAFGVAGHSGAGPHLFACACMLDPLRLKFVGALGPWGPMATAEIAAKMNMLDRLFAKVARRIPWTMRAAFAPIGWIIKHQPRLFLSMMKSALSPSDKQVVGEPDFAAFLQADMIEAFRQGGKGGAHEAFIAYNDWGFDISSIKVPTHIWLGDEDVFVSREMGRYLERTIPDVDFHWVKGKGHFNVENWDDILAACKRHV